MFAGIHHAMVTIPIGAEDEARAFYCDILGLEEVEKPDSLKGRGGLWLQVGDQQVHIGVEEANYRAETRAHLAYLVTNLTELRDKLESMEIVTKDNAPIPNFVRFEIRDPFGNRIEFIQEIP